MGVFWQLHLFNCGHILQLMDKVCYKDIEKIKTIGSTYMAAVGLVPTVGTEVRTKPFFTNAPSLGNSCMFDVYVTVSSHSQAKKSVYDHLSTIADYAIEMFDVLDEINYQSYNEFVLRVGPSMSHRAKTCIWLVPYLTLWRRVLHRHQRRAGGCRGDRGAATSIWHLGKHSQCGEQDGQHWSTRKDTGIKFTWTSHNGNQSYLKDS